MRANRLVPVLCCLVVGSAAVVVIVAAAPPPMQLCSACGQVDDATAPGTVDVYVDSGGDSRWVERIPVTADAAERYADDPDAVASVVDDGAVWHVAQGDATNPRTTLEDETIVVEYAVENVATPGVGDGWVLDYFYVGGTNQRYDLVADRATVHLPDGFEAANAPPNADVEDGTVTWTQDESAGVSGGPRSKTYVAYGPDGIAGAVESWTSAALLFGPLVLEHGTLASVLPVAVLSLAAATSARIGGSRRGVVSGLGRTVGDASRVALEDGCDRLGVTAGRRVIEAVALGSVTVVAGFTWVVVNPALGVLVGSFGVAAAAFLPLGYALARGGPTRRYGVAASVAPLAACFAFAPYYVLGFGPLAAGLLFLPWALGASLCGFVLLLVGRGIGATKPSREEKERSAV